MERVASLMAVSALPLVMVQVGEVATLGVEDLRQLANVELADVGADGEANPGPVVAAEGQVLTAGRTCNDSGHPSASLGAAT
jgi:hypothetical protein